MSDPKQRALKILSAFYDNSTPKSIKNRIKEWFISENNQEVKFEALQSVFLSMEPNTEPDEHEYELLDDVFKTIKSRELKTKNKLSLSRIVYRTAMVFIPFIVILGISYFVFNNNKPITVYAYNTEKSLTLPDNSEVIIYPNSQITYPAKFNTDRNVRLKGEAFFKIMTANQENGASEHFVVTTPSFITTVLGTEFKITEYENGSTSDLILYSGKVNVEANEQSQIITSGEHWHYDHVSGEKSISLIAAEEMLDAGYKPGLKFENATHYDIILALEANFDMEADIPAGVNTRIGSISVDFENEPLEQIAYVLTLINNDFRYTIEGRKITITKK